MQSFPRPSALSYILFKHPAATKYKTFEIPKRKGGTRIIKAPNDALKLVQQKLSTLLQDCMDEIIQTNNLKNRISHGFKRKRSIITNAREHRNRRYVFNLDLANFFPSINFGRVRGYFIKDRNFALNENVATVIAQIACHENALPQGSPCSPVISNIITHVLDMHLVRLASAGGCTYSRYADDLTFSTNKRIFPTEIAVLSDVNTECWTPGAELERLIRYSGFEINPTKTRMQYRTSRQDVTGLIVNRKVNTRYEYRHNVRAMVHSLLKSGSFTNYETVATSLPPVLEKRAGTRNQLHGMLGFIDKIDLENKKYSEPSKNSGDSSGNELMYKRFLIFRNFFAAEVATVLCEGETDNLYLTHAIRSLTPDYPKLVTTGPDGKIKLAIRLYKYRQSSTARILGLNDGGTGPLATFIATYKRETAKFEAPGQSNPIIVLFDNDSGASSIRTAVKQASGKTLNGTEPYVHVIRNLYVVPTPLPNGATASKIEDFFDANLKATVVGGKTFNDSNNFDSAIHYGKKIFAHSVVRPNADSINFDGFRQLLTNLVSVIDAHHQI